MAAFSGVTGGVRRVVSVTGAGAPAAERTVVGATDGTAKAGVTAATA